MSRKSDAWLHLIQQIGEIESELSRLMQEKHNLGLSEYRALLRLSHAPKGELRMQELAAHLKLNQSSVSRMVERLERSGWTVRDVCADDKRGVYTVLTEKGRAHVTAAEASYEAALSAAIKAQGLSDILGAGKAMRASAGAAAASRTPRA